MKSRPENRVCALLLSSIEWALEKIIARYVNDAIYKSTYLEKATKESKINLIISRSYYNSHNEKI